MAANGEGTTIEATSRALRSSSPAPGAKPAGEPGRVPAPHAKQAS